MSGVLDSALRDVPYMGVIRVNVEAMTEHGYTMGDMSWSNLGQGQPEVGLIEGAPPRFDVLTMERGDYGYGPIEGIPALREAIAAHYNRLYRQGKKPIGPENIAVAPGGRAALTRIGAILGRTRLAHFSPDYTAYEDLLTTFSNLEPVHFMLRPEDHFVMSAEALSEAARRERLGAVLLSNPCNPTGTVLRGQALNDWVGVCREQGILAIFDEFYSHFTYDGSQRPVSAIEFVDDIETDPIIAVDGLTKSFRYPGWRVGWVVASTKVIQKLAAAGSFLDGGACAPIQKAAAAVLEPARADQETNAVRTVFQRKRDLTLARLEALGIRFPHRPEGTFYAFGYVGDLPAPFNTGLGFMRAAFKARVLTVPGEFFDVNPGRMRTGPSPLEPWVRFSFGPPEANVVEGLDRLEALMRSLS